MLVVVLVFALVVLLLVLLLLLLVLMVVVVVVVVVLFLVLVLVLVLVLLVSSLASLFPSNATTRPALAQLPGDADQDEQARALGAGLVGRPPGESRHQRDDASPHPQRLACHHLFVDRQNDLASTIARDNVEEASAGSTLSASQVRGVRLIPLPLLAVSPSEALFHCLCLRYRLLKHYFTASACGIAF